MKNVLVIIGSVRDDRRGDTVANWFLPIIKSDGRFEVNVADLADYEMSLNLGSTEPSERKDKKYPNADVQKWSDKVESADSFIFITPEYNHAMPASIKNAIDQIYWEWLGKPVGFVGYGSRGAVDSIDSLKHTMKALDWQVIQPFVGIIKVKKAFAEDGRLIESEEPVLQVNQMLDSLNDALTNS